MAKANKPGVDAPAPTASIIDPAATAQEIGASTIDSVGALPLAEGAVADQPPPATTSNDLPSNQSDDDEPVWLRMLVDKTIDDIAYKANQVVGFDPALAEELVASGEADDSDAGIDYCLKELGETMVEHFVLED